MKNIVFPLWAICLALNAFAPWARAYEFSSPEAADLAERIAADYQGGRKAWVAPEVARAMERAYLDLDRSRLTPEDYIEIDYRMAAWRQQFEAALPTRPVSLIDIPPTVQSKYGARGWLNLLGVDSENYDHEGNDVLIAGTRFQPGDLLVTELMDDDVGAYTVIARPRGQFSHVGMYVLIHQGARRIPAVVEMHEGGARVVPLARFLSPQFTAYTEVYRLRSAPPRFAARLSGETDWVLARTTNYDFLARPPDFKGQPTSFTCASLADYLLVRSGADLRLPLSRMTDGASRNLARLGIPVSSVLTPTDFARSPDLRAVGIIDNRQMPLLVARALIAGTPDLPDTFAGAFSQRELDMDKLPLIYSIVASLAPQAKSGWASGLLSRAYGFDGPGQVPNGSPGILAFAYFASPEIYDSAREILDGAGDSINAILREGPFSLHDLQATPSTSELVREANRKWLEWFKTKP